MTAVKPQYWEKPLDTDDTLPSSAAVEAELSIIVPTLNEVENISSLLEALRILYPLASIIVVDDESIDGTQELVSSFARSDSLNSGSRSPVRLLVRNGASVKGLTASVLEGIRCCSSEYAVVMDADLQHPPEVVGEIIEQFRQGRDLVVCSRRSRVPAQQPRRRLLTLLGTAWARSKLDSRAGFIRDPLSGFFGLRVSAIDFVELQREQAFEGRGYKVLFDLLRSLPAAVSLSQIFYDFSKRPGGASKLGSRHLYYFMRSSLRGSKSRYSFSDKNF